MSLQTVSRVTVLGRQVIQHARRNMGISAVVMQRAATVSDPIQQLFLDKIREYKTKSAGGKLVDATPDVQSALKDELDKVDRMFSAVGKDMTQFPTFKFSEPQLETPGLGETKEIEDFVEEVEVIEEEEDNKPYFVLP